MDNDKDDDELRAANEGRERCWEEGGREIYLQSRLLMRTVLNAAAHTALYLAAGRFDICGSSSVTDIRARPLANPVHESGAAP